MSPCYSKGAWYVTTIFSFEPPFTPLEVTQTVATLNLSQLFSLNCFVVGDDPDRIFTVKVPRADNVSILKDLIKEKKAHYLNHIAASDLDLWKVDIDDLPTKNFLTDGPKLGSKLGSGELLLDVFPSEPDFRRIHVTVYVPVRSECYMDSWYNFAHYSVLRSCRRRERVREERSDQCFGEKCECFLLFLQLYLINSV